MCVSWQIIQWRGPRPECPWPVRSYSMSRVSSYACSRPFPGCSSRRPSVQTLFLASRQFRHLAVACIPPPTHSVTLSHYGYYSQRPPASWLHHADYVRACDSAPKRPCCLCKDRDGKPRFKQILEGGLKWAASRTSGEELHGHFIRALVSTQESHSRKPTHVVSLTQFSPLRLRGAAVAPYVRQ